MKNKILILFFMIIFITIFSNSQNLSLNIGYYENFPLIFKDKNGNPSGFFYDLINYILKKNNVKVKWIKDSFSNHINNLTTGKIDLLVDIAYSKEREQYLIFNNETILNNWGMLYCNKNIKFNNLFDLSKGKIGVVEKDIYYENGIKPLINSFKINSKFVIYKNYEDVFKSLNRKEINFGVVSRIFSILNENRFKNIRATSVIFHPVSLRIALSRKYVFNNLIVKIIDNELIKMKKDKYSFYYTVLNNYIYKNSNKYGYNKKIFILVMGILFLIIFVLFVFVYSLKILVKKKTSQLEKLNDKLKTQIKQKAFFSIELRKEKKMLYTIVNNIDEAIFTVNKEGIIYFFNKTGEVFLDLKKLDEKIYLWDHLKIVDKNDTYLHNSNADNFRKDLKENILYKMRNLTHQEKYNRITLYKLFDKDKYEYTIELTMIPVSKINNFDIDYIIILIKDLTEKYRLQNELINLEKLEGLRILAGGVAHDFNNYLSAILGNLAMLKISLENALKDNGIEVFNFINDMEKVSIKAKTLSTQLLNFSKTGNLNLKVSSIDKLIKETANFYLRGSHIDLDLDFEKGLWRVKIDVNKFEQVIQNLIINAIQAINESENKMNGKIKIKIENLKTKNELKKYFKDFDKKDFIKIAIQDNGKGIKKQDQNKIFNPFFTTKKNGNGLGLSTCFSIIKEHNGIITVNSVYGEGTTFLIYLPAIKPEKEKKLENSKENNEKTYNEKTYNNKLNSSDLKTNLKNEDILKKEVEHDNSNEGKIVPLKILIMDDEEHVLLTLKKMLESLKMEVIVTERGEEAIYYYFESKNSEKKVDLSILDLTVKKGKGAIETIQTILPLDPEFKAIVSSGYGYDKIGKNYKKYGFIDFLQKPYTFEELKLKITKFIKEYKLN